MNDTDNNQQRQTTPSIAKCHELADMVNILFDQSGLQDLLIGKYQLNKYDHFEHLQKYGQYSKLKQYCVLNGLDAQEVSIISSEQNLQHWNTTSGTLYQVEDLNAIRDCIRQKHSQCMAEYLRFLHFVNSTEKIGTSMRNAMAVDSNMILDSINNRISMMRDSDICTNKTTRAEGSLNSEKYSDKKPYITILCDTNILLNEVTVCWLLSMYQAGAHFELYTSRSIAREQRHIINKVHNHRFVEEEYYGILYKKYRVDLEYICEHMASFALLLKDGKTSARQTFLGSDLTDLHLHQAMVTNNIDILATNDLRLFSHLSREQRQQMPYTVYTADQCLADIVKKNMALMPDAIKHFRENCIVLNSDTNTQQSHTMLRLPNFHTKFFDALGLPCDFDTCQPHASSQTAPTVTNTEQPPQESSTKTVESTDSTTFQCPICNEKHTRTFSKPNAKKQFIRNAQALHKAYPQLSSPVERPYLLLHYTSYASTSTNTHGQNIQCYAKLGKTGISISIHDNDNVEQIFAQTLQDICPNCQLRADQFIDNRIDAETEYASQWQNSVTPDTSIQDFLWSERKRISVFLTSCAINVKERDLRFTYVPDYVCESEKTVIYIDSCLWHSQDYQDDCTYKINLLSLLQWRNKHGKERNEELKYRQQLQDAGWKVIQLPHCKAIEKDQKGAYACLFETISGEPFTQDVLLRPSQRVFELEQRIRSLEKTTQKLQRQLSTASSRTNSSNRLYVTK